ncbi:DUF397 domain-containing protein [Kineosporia babensis]|uniref:DUF397 domain-containing protein n=1 Tax=Kineosporia babensis TaxID=499548 RepID=UPI0038B26587
MSDSLPGGLTWIKASASAQNGCLQMAARADGSVVLRDSKNPDSGLLTCSPSAWEVFLHAARGGEMDGPSSPS